MWLDICRYGMRFEYLFLPIFERKMEGDIGDDGVDVRALDDSSR